jgi:hypothetical protein
MHCPQCGQEQTSDKIRFCTKCGFALTDVKEILVPGSRKKNSQKKLVRSITQGMALIIFGLISSMLFAILHELNMVPKSFAKISVLVFFVLGMIRMGLPFITGENSLPAKKVTSLEPDAATDNLIETSFSGKSLPEAQYSPPINFAAKNYGTAELASTPSVTENTTKLLKKELTQD